MFNRRSFFRAALMGSTAVALAGCGAITTSGTTVKVDFAKLDIWAEAAQSGVAAVLDIPGVSTLLGPAVTGAITAATAGMVADATALNAASGGAQTLSYNVSSLPTALTSFEGDASTILGDISTLFGANAATVVKEAQATLQALKTILLLAQTVGIPVGANVSAPLLPMSEDEALAILLPGKA